MTIKMSVIIYLKGFPALIIQLRHLLSDPCRNVGNGHMDDVLQEDGKVLQINKTVKIIVIIFPYIRGNIKYVFLLTNPV